MKAKLTILIVFLMVGIWSFADDPIRPPVKTNEFILEDLFTWQNDPIGKDSLVYFIQISNFCYKYRSLETASIWDTICFETSVPDTLVLDGYTIILINGGTFVRNDSIFQLRRDPNCFTCWQYKYSAGTEWKELYCEQTANGQFLIAENLQHLFWMYREDNGLDWVDSLKAVIHLADSGKVLMSMPDSTWQWQPLPDQLDSIVINGVKYAIVDSITININDPDSVATNELDSFLVNGIYVVNGDNININDADSDPTNEKDHFVLMPEEITIGDDDTVSLHWYIDSEGGTRNITGTGINGHPIGVGINGNATENTSLRVHGYTVTDTLNVGGSLDPYAIVGIYEEGGGTALTATSVNGGFAGKFYGRVWTSDSLQAGTQTTTPKLKVGASDPVDRLGTMATQNFWFGSESEFQALGTWDTEYTIYFRWPDEEGGGGE